MSAQISSGGCGVRSSGVCLKVLFRHWAVEREGNHEPSEYGCCPGFIIAGYTEEYKESREMKS